MDNVRKVVIYFPWKEVSGGPIYLARLADALAINPNYKVYYVDYEDGFSRQLISEPTVEKITVSQSDFSIPITEPITVITPIYFACWLPPLHPESKVLFINWHVCCIPTLQHNWNASDFIINKFLKMVSITNSVFFCDESHRIGQNTENVKFEKNIVPITLPVIERQGQVNLINQDEVNVVILGRLCRDKIFGVINVLDNLDLVNVDKKKVVHIVGNGPDKDLINVDKYKSLEIKFVGEITHAELTNYLISYCDCLFAMGTSVLEGAALSIPSVIIPHNMKPITCDKYVYIQDTKGFCLGWYDDQFEELELEPIKMSQVIQSIVKGDGKKNIGSSAYNYYSDNHTINKVIELFVNAIEGTNLTYECLKNILGESNVLKSLSIGNVNIFTLNKNLNGVDAKLLGKWNIFSLRNSSNPIWKIISIKNLDFFEIRKCEKFYKFKFRGVRDKKNSLNPESSLFNINDKYEREDIIENYQKKLFEKLDRNKYKIEDIIENHQKKLFEKLDRIDYSNVIMMDTCDKILSQESLQFFCGDIKDSYIDLIKNLDAQSIDIVTRIISRIQKYMLESTCYFWMTEDEESEFRKMMDSHTSKICQLSNNSYSYGSYILPCNIITSTVFYYKCFMPELLHLNKYKNKHIIDAGGSFGDSALILSEYTKERVHVFEPTELMFEMAQRTISDNALKNKVVLNKLALGEQEQKLKIRVQDDYSTLCFNDKYESGNTLEMIDVIKLDDYVKSKKLSVGVIKVDVEGFEEKLLQGALETIKSQKPALLFSIYHNSEQFFGIKPFIEQLNLGYSFKIRKPLDRSVIVDTILIAEVC